MDNKLISAYAWRRHHANRQRVDVLANGWRPTCKGADDQRHALADILQARAFAAKGEHIYNTMRDAVNDDRGSHSAVDPKDRRQWFADPAQCGFREAGDASDFYRHATQWYGDLDGRTLFHGVVFILPARDGQTSVYAGYRYTEDDGAVICMRAADVIDGRAGESPDYRSAAMAADDLARIAAEAEREYQTAWQAGSLWRSNREDLRHIAKQLRQARADLSTLPTMASKAGRYITDAISRHRAAMARILERMAELKSGDFEGLNFWPDDRLTEAFKEGAGL